MKFNRVWAMPNKATFTIKPIRELIGRYVNGGVWADPFAGWHSPAELTNDLNPDAPTLDHQEALQWSRTLKDGALGGVLFDPPYSPRQVAECYKQIGKATTMQTTQANFWTEVKDALAPKVREEGIAICCGWTSQGFGKNRGFELLEILLVPHGGHHNDTIVTVERRPRKRGGGAE